MIPTDAGSGRMATSPSGPICNRRGGALYSANAKGRKIMKKLLFASFLALFALASHAEDRLETRFEGKRTVVIRDGKELDFKTCLAEELRAHPEMSDEDVLERCFQAAYGGEYVTGLAGSPKKRFDFEYASAKPRPGEPLFEVVSPDFMRVNLGAWKGKNLPPGWLFEMFSASAVRFDDGDALLARYLADAEQTLEGEMLERFRQRKKAVKGRGQVIAKSALNVGHLSYHRLASTRFLHALPVLMRAAALPENGKVRIIAIDGRAASGKTTLARQLARITGAEVIHMDDFFLPLELRTNERYREPGGNVHYERFAAEVLPFLRDPRGFSYRAFDCSTMNYGKAVEVKPSAWRIVEGAYSLHPKFGDYADLKVFYDIAPGEQMRRITLRNGEARAQIFRQRWIPLEENYIRSFDIPRRADLILGADK